MKKLKIIFLYREPKVFSSEIKSREHEVSKKISMKISQSEIKKIKYTYLQLVCSFIQATHASVALLGSR